jgi:hypothetical protein
VGDVIVGSLVVEPVLGAEDGRHLARRSLGEAPAHAPSLAHLFCVGGRYARTGQSGSPRAKLAVGQKRQGSMMNQLRWIRERVAYWLFVSNVGFVVAVIVLLVVLLVVFR